MEISDIFAQILSSKKNYKPVKKGSAFAPVNIALAKYWGKRDEKLNLPINESFSIALPEKGAFTEILPIDNNRDVIIVNGKELATDTNFYKRLTTYLNHLRATINYFFQITIYINIPVSTGLASSACGFASLILALNDLFVWELDDRELSILARLGSGSAARSLWLGFVHWFAGIDPDGMDSFAKPIHDSWQDLRIGLFLASAKEKQVSSRQAMQHSKNTSPYFEAWIKQNANIVEDLIKTVKTQNFTLFGSLVEANSLTMHETLATASPPIIYANETTLGAIKKVWQAREQGLSVYFTQDAGPNLKLFFLKDDLAAVQSLFPNLDLLIPFKLDQAKDEVILVDKNDRAIGTTNKLYAHQHSLCHRAFSVFIFRKQAGNLEVLLQQRQTNKLHCENLWSNTCCSHPKPGEDIFSAATNRLQEEMGMNIKLYPRGVFRYMATFDNGITENEVDHVFVGYSQDRNAVYPNSNEVQNYKWMGVETLSKELVQNPQHYTPWLQKALQIAINNTYCNCL